MVSARDVLKYGLFPLYLAISVYLLNFYLFWENRQMTLIFWGIGLVLFGFIGAIGSGQELSGRAKGVWAAAGPRTVTKGNTIPSTSEVAKPDQEEGSPEGMILVVAGVITFYLWLLSEISARY